MLDPYIAPVLRMLEQLVEKVHDCCPSHHLLKVVVLVVSLVINQV